jgi:hypothetical protein
MTDIVEELRDAEACWDTDAWRLCGSAADEIERLREALREIRDYEGNFPVIYDGDDAIAMKEIARAALGEKK